MLKFQTAADAVKLIESNDRVFVHGGVASPVALINAMTDRHEELRNVEIVHLHLEGKTPYADIKYKDSFHVNSFFIGHNLRNLVDKVNVQYVPIFLSEIPALFRRGLMKVDTALIQVSVPDNHGYCSLGTSVDIAKSATEVARKIIALVNPKMPRTHGDSQIHISKFSAAVYSEDEILQIPVCATSEVELAIGKHVASLVEDGATLQLGIGGIPAAVVQCLSNHKDLGIHTEMFTDAILPLVEKGVITGVKKKKHPGKIVSTFVLGSRKLFDFMHDNPMVAMLDAGYVNDTSVIRKNDKVTAINSAVEIDLSGQICADSVGYNIISGVGGQMDFIRGASLSEGGKPIIAMPSVTSKGLSKIVPLLKQGAGVVTTRAHVHYVVTEYGVAYLYGKNLAQRAKALAAIAHPDFREELEREAKEIYG